MFEKSFLQRLLIVLTLAAMVVALSSCSDKPAEEGRDDTPDKPAGEVVDGDNGMIALPVELPAAIVEGTPPNLSAIENMETYVKTDRPIFYVPAGTTNVALNKPVTATDENPIGGTLDQVNDGDMNGADGSWLEFGLFEQYVTVDLGDEHEIYAILVWHFHKQARVYYDVVVQTSDDPDFITNVNTLFNNDTDNTHGLGSGTDKNYVEKSEGRLIDGKGTKGRYVRFYSNGNNENELNHYVEVAVYGKTVE